MLAIKSLDYISIEDYLEGEKVAAVKHEYVYGQVYAMAGASNSHNIIAVNIVARLYEASQQKFCSVYVSDMKVKVNKDIFYYPDVMVICEKDNENDYYKEKPCLIVEIFSKSTERIDKHEKLQAYLAMPSLQTYLMVDSRQRFVKGYHRSESGWEECAYQEQNKMSVDCLGMMLSFEEVYRGLEL